MKIKNQKGFSLIELLLVISIVAILASAILVAISGQREKARASKVLMELSATLQPMMMCWSDGGTIGSRSNGGNICSLGGSYGQWPNLSSSGWTYVTGSVPNSGNWSFGGRSGSSTITCSSSTDSCVAN